MMGPILHQMIVGCFKGIIEVVEVADKNSLKLDHCFRIRIRMEYLIRIHFKECKNFKFQIKIKIDFQNQADTTETDLMDKVKELDNHKLEQMITSIH